MPTLLLLLRFALAPTAFLTTFSTPLEATTRWQLAEARKQVELTALKRGSPPHSVEDATGGVPVYDAWGRPIVLVPRAGGDFDLVSFGADGAPGASVDLWGVPWGADVREP